MNSYPHWWYKHLILVPKQQRGFRSRLVNLLHCGTFLGHHFGFTRIGRQHAIPNEAIAWGNREVSWWKTGMLGLMVFDGFWWFLYVFVCFCSTVLVSFLFVENVWKLTIKEMPQKDQSRYFWPVWRCLELDPGCSCRPSRLSCLGFLASKAASSGRGKQVPPRQRKGDQVHPKTLWLKNACGFRTWHCDHKKEDLLDRPTIQNVFPLTVW